MRILLFLPFLHISAMILHLRKPKKKDCIAYLSGAQQWTSRAHLQRKQNSLSSYCCEEKIFTTCSHHQTPLCQRTRGTQHAARVGSQSLAFRFGCRTAQSNSGSRSQRSRFEKRLISTASTRVLACLAVFLFPTNNSGVFESLLKIGHVPLLHTDHTQFTAGRSGVCYAIATCSFVRCVLLACSSSSSVCLWWQLRIRKAYSARTV